MFDTLKVFIKYFVEKVCFEKNQQTTKKHAKLPCRQRVTFYPQLKMFVIFSHLLMFLGSLYGKQYGPRIPDTTAPRVHIACFMKKSSQKCT